MTEKDSKDTEAAAAPAPKSNFAKAAAEGGAGKKAAKPARGGRGKGWLWLLLFLALAGGAGTWAWYSMPQFREQLAGSLDFLPLRDKSGDATTADSKPQPTAKTPAEPDNTRPTADTSQQTTPATAPTQSTEEITALRRQLEQQQRDLAGLRQKLATLQRNVTAQGNRLGELGNASRDDWQLAEADYLLRLANQRLLLEGDSRAALGLLEEVDKILQRVDLPDLYGVRQQLARDITALKLVENIDREGLYLRLRALEEQLLRVSIQPQFDLVTRDPAERGPTERGPTETETSPEAETASAWQRSWQKFTRFMSDSYRIRDSEIDPVLLSPQSEARFRQSLRLNMEQAELALLRQDGTVYKDVLNSARELLQQYAAPTNQREVLARELEALREEPIETELPSLAVSQSALRNYIDRLHKTSGTTAPDVEAPGNDAPDTGAPGGDDQ